MSRPGDLLPRVGVAVVGIPLVLLALLRGGWLLGAVAAAAAALGTREFYRLAQLRGEQPFSLLGAGAGAAVVLLAVPSGTWSTLAPGALGVLLALAAVTLALSPGSRWPGGSPLSALASTLAGVVYVALPLAFLPLLRQAGEGAAWGAGARPGAVAAFVLLPLLVTWAGDTAAYLVGTAVGRTRLAPTISPGKSLEGALGGMAGSVGAGVLVSWLWLSHLVEAPVTPATAAWVGALLGVAAQVGDLAESLLKREAGVKDSGRLLPGHGGLLDRVDSLLWTLPLAWWLLALVRGPA
ncbi:MAG: phosphatidate cytidylyltransferase [Longimicrobiales bacterium]|nr:phosphatidate cytidylyltransferase [Longimicrobiales bacterium]